MRRTTIVATGILVSTLALAGPAMATNFTSATAAGQGVGMHWERDGRHGFGPERFRGFAFGFGAPNWRAYNWAPYGGYWRPGDDGYGYRQVPYPYAGGVKLEVSGPDPKHAEVYANGAFVGTENNFRGLSHRLTLRPGAYTIQVRAKGYEPLTIPIRIQHDKTITYKGQMKKIT